jgi:hypothetical protein
MRTSAALVLIVGIFASALFGASTPARAGGEEPRGFFERERQTDRPIVRVVSPAGGAYVSSNHESRLLIVLEIVDVSGRGIASDDFGVPRFLGHDPNVALFASHLISMNRFTDGQKQEVLQLVSEVPVDELVLDTRQSVTAPLDSKSISPKWRPLAYPIPLRETVPFAGFSFRVKDRRGALSENEALDLPSLVVGFVSPESRSDR